MRHPLHEANCRALVTMGEPKVLRPHLLSHQPNNQQMIVTLTQNDVSRAVSVATFHTLRCVLLGAMPKNNQDVKRRLDDTLAGYLSEVATAKVLGLPWPQDHTLSWEGRDKGDLVMPDGQSIEVRGSPNPNARYLLGQKDDHPVRV